VPGWLRSSLWRICREELLDAADDSRRDAMLAERRRSDYLKSAARFLRGAGEYDLAETALQRVTSPKWKAGAKEQHRLVYSLDDYLQHVAPHIPLRAATRRRLVAAIAAPLSDPALDGEVVRWLCKDRDRRGAGSGVFRRVTPTG